MENAFCFQKQIMEVELEYNVKRLLQYAEMEEIMKTRYNIDKLRHKTGFQWFGYTTLRCIILVSVG